MFLSQLLCNTDSIGLDINLVDYSLWCRVLVTVEESRGFFESLFQSNDDEDEEANMDLQVEESADDVQADSGDAIRALCMDQPLKTAEQRRAEMKAKLSNSDDTRQVQRKNDNMTQEERQLLGDSK